MYRLRTLRRSLRIQTKSLQNNLASCRIPKMKPNKKYRLSFFLKTEKLTGPLGAGAWIYFSKGTGLALPRVRISGDNPWHRLTFDFTAPADTACAAYATLVLNGEFFTIYSTIGLSFKTK